MSGLKPIILTSMLITLTACGSTMQDRALSGGGIGLAAGIVLGNPGATMLIGAGAGVLTDQNQLDLGDPVWK